MKPLLLTFDVEELDWPVELGHPLSIDQQIEATAEGTQLLLPLLRHQRVVATFFATGTFARHRPDILRALTDAGHEVGVHGLKHTDDYASLPEAEAFERLREAKLAVESASRQAAIGVRTPRLRRCPPHVLRRVGFLYDASPHPTWVPGRYNGLALPRHPWHEDGILLVPVSVLPFVRLPVSWLWYRVAGENLGTVAAHAAALGAPYLHLYFHPWEAVSLRSYGIPPALAWRSGPAFLALIDRLLHASEGIYKSQTVGTLARQYGVGISPAA